MAMEEKKSLREENNISQEQQATPNVENMDDDNTKTDTKKENRPSSLRDVLVMVNDMIFTVCNNVFIWMGVSLLVCKILRRDMSDIRIILIRCAYAIFAFLVLMFPICMKERVSEDRLYIPSLIVGFIILGFELGLVLFALW